MATVAIDKNLDVTTKYQSLITKLVTDDTSVYIHTVEKLEALITAGDLTSADKAGVISKVLGELNSSIVNASLQTALQWSKAEKDAEFQKRELEEKIDLLKEQVNTEAAKTLHTNAERVNVSAQTRRMYGAAVVDAVTGTVTSLSDDGKLYHDMQIVKQQLLNEKQTENVLKGKIRESQAAVYKIAADTRANFGNAQISLSDTAATITLSDGSDTQVYWQREIAKKQAAGYGYNAWANAVNASGSMLGTLIGSELDSVWSTDGTDTKVGNQLLALMKQGMTKLIAAG
jgi:hypothetical protein